MAEQIDETEAPLEPQEDESDLDLGIFKQRFPVSIGSSDWTAETLISQLRKGNIQLDPSFQRRDAWTITRKSQYIESLILGIPTPQIILAESRERRGTYVVIDGKQRLLSLRQFSAEEDDQKFKNFKLKGLTARPELNGLTFRDISTKFEFIESAGSDFENATVRTVVIRSWPNEDFLYEVFLRINRGSVQLSPQELRQALHPGPFTDRLNEFSIESELLKKILGLSSPDFRMRDNELVLRYLAFKNFSDTYSGNLKSFFDDTTKFFNSNWSALESACEDQLEELEIVIQRAIDIWGNYAFHKWNGRAYESRLNRAVFDVVAYYLADDSIARQALDAKERVVDEFKAACRNRDFSDAVSATTKSVDSVRNRFEIWGEHLSDAIESYIDIPEIGE